MQAFVPSIVCEVLPFSVCPVDRFLESLKKRKTNPHSDVLSLFMAVSTASFFSLVLLSETACSRVSLKLHWCFPGPVEDLNCNNQPCKWQQVGKTHVGYRKLRASHLSLGWCSKSNPSNTSGTAVASRVSIPLMHAMAFLLGIWNGHRLLFPAPRDSWGRATASLSHITASQWQWGKHLLSTVFLLASTLCLNFMNQNIWKADTKQR